MKRKLTSMFLSATLLISSVAPVSYANTPKESLDSNIDNVMVRFDETAGAKQKAETANAVVASLEKQTDEKYTDADKITIIVEINDRVMKEKYSLVAPDISKVKTEEGLSAQLDYAKKSQSQLIDAMDKTNVDYIITEKYDTVLNGFAIKTTLKDARVIAGLPEVESVEVSRLIPAPPKVEEKGRIGLRDNSSNDMINAPSAWNSKYSGKGQLIAIIDSGGDPDHEIFASIEKDGRKYSSESEVEALIKSRGIASGKYFNDKIPFGYNYADKNIKIKERGKTSHGMHVAGIIAGNSRKLKGVAPDAQVAVMRAFSDNALFGGTTAEIYNRAIDDSVKLGVDSINMSLGATGTTDSRMEQTTINALRDAQKAGIVVAIAIGNDGFMGFGALDGPQASNPDFGLTNSPAVTDISLAVASVDNAQIKERGIVVNTPSAGSQRKILFNPSDDKPFPKENILVVNAGHGYPEDFQNINVRGKIALIRRGDAQGDKRDLTFGEKVKNAENNGAIAAIVYNNIEEDGLTHMAGMDAVTIPSCFISKADGEYIIANIQYPIRFESEESYTANPSGYRVSNFSSWGMTPEGNMKPDISAPGGKIYSSVNDNAYEIMSGTSMATPHVAGGIAVAKQYVEKNFANVQGEEKHRFVKNLLMSTAVPYLDKRTGAFGSPRGQGAGLMSLSRTIQSSVVIEGTNKISSINLRNIKGNSLEVKGVLRNYANEAKNFNYYAELSTDTVENGKIMLKPRLVESTKNAKQSITVPANGTADFTVSFTLSDEKIKELEKDMPKGFFLEGYVVFESSDKKNSEISVPFVGFRGDWQRLSVMDDSIYHHLQKGTKPYYYEKSNIVPGAFTHISSKESGTPVILGEMFDSTFENPKFELNKIAFSPNGDGKADEVGFEATFLRNYKDFEISVYRENDNNLTASLYRVARPDDFGIKNFVVLGPFGGPNLTTTKTHWKWDGKNVSGEALPEGNYIFVAQAVPDGSGNTEPQKMKFPIMIDRTFPRIMKSSYDQATGKYKLEVKEDGSGIRSSIIRIDKKDYMPDSTGTFSLPAGTDPSTAELIIQDHARNTVQLPLNKSIRNGNERMVIVSPKISSGSVPSDKFRWEVQDMNGKVVDPYNLAVGSYELVITHVDDAYEIKANRIPFTVGDNDFTKVVEVEFNYKNRTSVVVIIENSSHAKFNVVFVDKKTGAEYIASPKSPSQYIANVPEGEYKVTVRDFDEEKYVVVVENSEIQVHKTGQRNTYPHVRVYEKEKHPVKVTLVRNDYTGKAKVVFRGQDIKHSLFEVDFAEGETQKTVELYRKITFDVYTTNIEGNTHGSKTPAYTPSRSNNYSIKVTLVKGAEVIPVPVDKSALSILINQSKGYLEKDYEPEGWEVFEKVLDKADKIYNRSDVTQSEIDQVVKELKEAIDGLVLLQSTGNKSLLKAKIEEAKKILDSLGNDYTDDSVQFLTIAIQGAELTYSSKDPKYNTEQHINATIDMLERAIKNLRRKDGKVDKSQLGAYIAEAEGLIANSGLYTDASIAALRTALEEVKDVFNNSNASHEDVQEAILDIRLAISNVESKADKTKLKNEIALSEALDLTEYELQGKSEFRAALRMAKEVLANKRALKDAIDKATQTLQEKREALRKKGQPIGEHYTVPVTIKEDGQISEFNSLVVSKSTVTKKANGKYEYKIQFNKMPVELNGKTFTMEISSLVLKDSGQVVTPMDKGNMVEYRFELDSKKNEISTYLGMNLMQELGVRQFVTSISMDWDHAIQG